jgi:hypothetical protein
MAAQKEVFEVARQQPLTQKMLEAKLKTLSSHYEPIAILKYAYFH